MRSKPLILIVDDEENFREIFSAKIGAAGFDVQVAKNEAEAIAKAKELMPDLILMDIFMPPGPTGTDIALNIHQDSETKMLKIAFLTNLKEPWPAIQGDHQKISQELGMEDFLEKTGNLDDLVKKINEILARSSAPKVPGATTVQPEPVSPAPVQAEPISTPDPALVPGPSQASPEHLPTDSDHSPQ
ncbi:MAG: two-component response transcriptional regulator (OmpR family) [Parcubacteria group bacterium Gr01-1014_20]|nr:MAG: two-component response transcriptional regulator (OmpR family) [Parcubacteria group bacterium Gr01-1014_20]